ncbi:hypothetical protein EBU91_04560, partial [bacterium]|nr:hypothetical protein [bacterium]
MKLKSSAAFTDSESSNYVYRFKGKDYEFKSQRISLDKLLFWTENPRTNLLNPPKDQASFYNIFQKDNNVDDLVKKLRTQHQLEPLIVKKLPKGVFLVREGNSRLAAMKIINEDHPLRCKEAKCYVAPDGCPDKVLDAIVDERHGEDPPVKKWTPFGRGIYYQNLLKKYKTLKAVSDIVHAEPNQIQLYIKASNTLIKVSNGSEPDKDRFSAVLETHKFFQRETTYNRKKVYTSLLNVSLSETYGGFGSATLFRNNLSQLCQQSPNIIKRGLKKNSLPEIIGKSKIKGPIRNASDQKIKKHLTKQRTPQLVRRIRNLLKEFTDFQND